MVKLLELLIYIVEFNGLSRIFFIYDTVFYTIIGSLYISIGIMKSAFFESP